MDDLPVKHPGPFNQKITASCKTRGLYLKLLLLLLLENVKHNQSLMRHCRTRTESSGLPNFTSEAGSPFLFKLPIPATTGHTQHHRQLSLADGDSTLPHWMVFRHHASSLAGLALTEDCGIYHLEVSDIGGRCAAQFYLHILNRTDKNPARDTLSCSEREMNIWASLVLQLNPLILDASRRIHLVSTMADYLHLPPGFVYLFSTWKSIIQQEGELIVCRRGGLAEKMTSGTEEQDVAELLLRVGCQGEEQQSDFAAVLEYIVKAGGLARLLEAPVSGWRVLCAPGGVRHNVKRDVQGIKFTPTLDMIVPPPTQVHQLLKLEHSHVNYLPLTGLEPSLLTILLRMSHVGTRLEPTRSQDSTENTIISVSGMLMSHPGVNPLMPSTILKSNHMQKIQASTNSFFSKQASLYPYSKTVNALLEHLEFTGKNTLYTSLCVEFGCEEVSEITSVTSQSISDYFQTTEYRPLPFLPESTVRTFAAADTLSTPLPSSTRYSIYPPLPLTPATSTLTHEAVDRELLATRLTLRPHQKETPLWTGSYRDSHSDSESQPSVGTLGHVIFNQGPIKNHHTAKPTLYNLPSVSRPLLTENCNALPPLSPALQTIQSLPPSDKMPSTQLFPDVSPPTSYLMAERLSTTQHSDTIQHLPASLNQDIMSQLNVTTQDESSTAPTLSGQTELESSLSASLSEASVTTFTPALPSELFSGRLETSSVNLVFTVESPRTSSSTTPPLQTFSTFLPPHVGVSSALTQTLSSDVLLVSLQPARPSWALHTSLPLTETLSVPLSLIKDEPCKPSVTSARESVRFMPSVQRSLHTQLIRESQQSNKLSNIFLVTEIQKSMYLNPAAGPSGTTGRVSEEYFDPTAPPTVQEAYATSFFHQMQTLHPSFPLCGRSVTLGHVDINACTPQIKSTHNDNIVEHVLDSYSQGWTAFPSQFFTFDSKFIPTQTSRRYLSLHPLPSAGVTGEEAESNEPVSPTHLSTATPITFTPSALSTSALSGSHVMVVICQSPAADSRGPITKGRPTLQTLSTTSSRFYGMSAALLTSLLSSCRGESSVQPTPSASISSSMNLPPKALQSIPALMATVGFPFHYSIPPKTFRDPEDGDADALSLQIRLIDGPPVSVGTWLALDGLELHGVPLEVDLQFAPQRLLLAARDAQGLSTWLPLTLDLRRSPVDPCHVFTLTAQRSLHSVLRHRRRVELLLGKLSRFFNSSSGRHLSVVSMRPGSTVVSWYNNSLCAIDQSRAARCRVDQIRSMWLAMRSADGSVQPAFREAMLPEFPITTVGPVSYRRDCFSTTSSPPAAHTTTTPGLSTNTSLSPTSNTCLSPAITTSQQTTHYQWMAGMFTALLLVCLLILIVLLVAALLHFCKGHGRSRSAAIWPAIGVLSVQSRDLRAIRPRRPPLLQPELPPPPLRLWINLSHGDEGRVPSTRERGRKTGDKALQPRPPQCDFSSI